MRFLFCKILIVAYKKLSVNMCIFDGGMINLDTLFKLGIVIVVGLLGGKLARKFKLPNVTGYLLAGLLLTFIFKLISLRHTKLFDY